jgi:hypothetical protein
MLTVIIVLALAVSGYFLYKKYKTSNNSEEILVKEVLKNIDAKPPTPEVSAEPSSSLEEVRIPEPQIAEEVKPLVQAESSLQVEVASEPSSSLEEVKIPEPQIVEEVKLVKKKKRRYYTKK